MDKTEFLAAIKLVSGEELLSMVTPVNNEDGDYLVVENPIEIEEVILPNKQAGAKVQPWMKFSREDQFIIPKDKIMTITNASLEMSTSYGQIVKNYDKLDKPKRDENYHKKEFTPEENKKLNEIFRELDDEEEEPTLH